MQLHLFQTNYIIKGKIANRQNNDQRALSCIYFNVSDFLTWIDYRLIIPLVIVAIEQGSFQKWGSFVFHRHRTKIFRTTLLKMKKYSVPEIRFSQVKIGSTRNG